MQNKQNTPEHPVLLFDGVCNLCDGFVQWLIRRDKARVFRYAPIQSEAGQSLFCQFDLPLDEISTVVLVEGNRIYTHADVSLRIGQLLGGWWKLTGLFYIVPPAIRNTIYNWVARNRYRWFGEKDQCMMPTPELKQLFL